MFSTLREPPVKGSLRESVLLLYCIKKEEIQYIRDLALAQIQVAKDRGIEFFDDYRKKMFPWIETAKGREKDQHTKLLEQIVKAGPLVVRPLGMPKAKSRLVERKERSLTPEQKKSREELYKKLGKSIPV